MARRCIITVGLASRLPSGTHRNRLERRPGETERETGIREGRKRNNFKECAWHRLSGKAFRLTGLALAGQAGHSVSAGPEGEGPPSLYGLLCQCSRLLAGLVLRRDAALGSLCMAGISRGSDLPRQWRDLCLSVPLAALRATVNALASASCSVSPGLVPEIGSCSQNSTG